MMMHIPRMIQNRHGTYYYRLHNGSIDVRISLRTKNPKEAVERLRTLETCISMPTDDVLTNFLRKELGINVDKITAEVNQFPELRHFYNSLGIDSKILPKFELGTPPPSKIIIGTNSQTAVQSFVGESATPAAIQKTSESFRSISKLVEDFSAYNSGKIALKTEKDRQRVWQEFIAEFGDLKTGDVTKAVSQQYKQKIGALSKSRQKTCISHMRVLFAYALEAGEIETNPFVNLTISGGANTDAPTEMFTTEELNKIFSPTIFLPSQRLNLKKGGYFWAPILVATTGARSNEIAQLRVKDIKVDSDIHYIDINDEGEDQSIKTRASKRRVPIHNSVIELGFLDFVSAMREYHTGEGGDGQLFLCMSFGTNGWSKNLSRDFNEKRLPKAFPDGLPDGKRLRSFRKTFIVTLTGLGVSNPLLRSVVGHSDLLGPVDTHVKNYNNSHSLSDCKAQVIDRFPLKFLEKLNEQITSIQR